MDATKLDGLIFLAQNANILGLHRALTLVKNVTIKLDPADIPAIPGRNRQSQRELNLLRKCYSTSNLQNELQFEEKWVILIL
jgi:hypothetical protein